MTDQYCLNVKQKTLEGYTTAQSPGPAYSPDYSPAYPRSPTYKFGTSNRDERKSAYDGPSPGEYDVAGRPTTGHIVYDSTKRSTSQTKFGSSGRGDSKVIDTPGPGSYNYDGSKGGRPVSAYSQWRTPPAYSMGTMARSDSPRKGEGPGPADYGAPNGIGKQALSNRPSSAHYRFGSGSREGAPERARSPGPVYTVPESIGKQALSSRKTSPHSKFGTSTRDEQRKDDSPAPGDHDYREKPGKTLFGKNPPSWGMGSSQRGAGEPHPQSPGPSYMVEGGIGKQVTSTRPSSATYGFGSSSRDRARNAFESPGPGAHMYEEAPGKNLRGRNAPLYRFGSSQRDSGGPRVQSPGPQYKIESRPSSPSYKFGSSTRDEMKKAEVPGPASYMFEEPPGKNLKGQNAATFRFGTSSRDGPRKADRGPGPGGYATMQGIGKQPISTKRTSAMSKFGSDSRFPANKDAESPSPADYYHVPKSGSGPAWTMLSR